MTGNADETQRIRRARLANMRQELLAPVNAIMGYSEMLHEEAARLGLEEIAPDLDRIVSSARDLFGLVDRLLDQELVQMLFEGKEVSAVQQKLRHDLRTPINAIKGYGEMLLEDLAHLGGESLRPDFVKLVTETNRLLSQLDYVVDFSRASLEFQVADKGKATGTMIPDLVRSIRPVSGEQSRSAVTGTILVVDDIEGNRDLLERRLTREGHGVAKAENGRQALHMLKSQDFDLVLLDLIMPEVNGFEVLKEMKADPHLHEIPVIMISALDELDSVIRCIEAGAEDYLPKPFDPVLLRARIDACLEKKEWRDRERLYLNRLETERANYQKLLLNILPARIIERLNEGETVIADRFDNVSVLFADLVGFMEISNHLPPTQLVNDLNRLFSHFDAIAQELGVEKVKMIGDAYMAVAGAPEPRPDHAEAIARMALGMIDILKRISPTLDRPLRVRIGVHTGPVIAGIIGTHRFVYDIWGDTVNVASRLETHSLPNRIQISDVTAHLISGSFELEPRGSINIKGKGKLKSFFLNAPARSSE